MTDILTPVVAATAATRWIDEVSGPLVCVEVVDVTHDVKNFSFELPGVASLQFLAGQYLTFRFEIDGEQVERCYTISSSPAHPARVTITVKRVPDGPVSNWLHDHLRIGDEVTASGPLGEFSCSAHPSDRYLFLSAGSGITPSMSMLRMLCDTEDPADVAFVHSARTPDDIIFRGELETLTTQPNVTVAAICEADSESEEWTGARGRLSLPTLLTFVPDLLDREIFVCGPPGYMAAVREMVDLLGIDPARYHEESFDLGSPDADDASATTGVRHRVEFRRSGQVVECDEGTPILTAAAQAGLPMPSSCGEGVCGTCKQGLLAGSVDMQHAGGIRKREVDEGKILLCCSKPCEDLIIDT